MPKYLNLLKNRADGVVWLFLQVADLENKHSFAELTQSQESGPSIFGYEIFTSLVLSADFLPILLALKK